MNTYCGPGETYQSGTGAACGGAVNDVDNTGWVMASYYDFNALRLNVAYGQAHKTNRITGTRNTDTSDFLIGFSGYQIGNGKLLVTLVRHTDKGTGTAAYWKNNAPRKMATWMFGANYDYYLSKRTKFMFGLMLMRSNSDYALMPLSATYQGGQTGNFRNSGLYMGMNHRF
jgi:predicted porin